MVDSAGCNAEAEQDHHRWHLQQRPLVTAEEEPHRSDGWPWWGAHCMLFVFHTKCSYRCNSWKMLQMKSKVLCFLCFTLDIATGVWKMLQMKSNSLIIILWPTLASLIWLKVIWSNFCNSLSPFPSSSVFTRVTAHDFSFWITATTVSFWFLLIVSEMVVKWPMHWLALGKFFLECWYIDRSFWP